MLYPLNNKAYYPEMASKIVGKAYASADGLLVNSEERPELEAQFAQLLRVLDEAGVTYNESDLCTLVKYFPGSGKVSLDNLIVRRDEDSNNYSPITLLDLLPVTGLRSLFDIAQERENDKYDAIKVMVRAIGKSKLPSFHEDIACLKRLNRGEERRTDNRLIRQWVSVASEFAGCNLGARSRIDLMDELRQEKARSWEDPTIEELKYIQWTRSYTQQAYKHEQRTVARVELF